MFFFDEEENAVLKIHDKQLIFRRRDLRLYETFWRILIILKCYDNIFILI